MSVTISDVLATQSALYGAVRRAVTRFNETAQTLRLAEWPVERAGCLYTLSVTLERGGREIGECRFTIDWKGETFFDADDQPLARCEASFLACEQVLTDFIERRAAQAEEARNAA